MTSLAIAFVLVATVVPSAGAAWSRYDTGSSASQATSLGAGSTRTVNAKAKTVTVTWATGTYANGASAPAYVVRRYSSVTGVGQTIGSACSGTLTGLTCTESNVPTGTWRYSVTPAPGNWRGIESARSAIATVT